jgi:hypothetical protein
MLDAGNMRGICALQSSSSSSVDIAIIIIFIDFAEPRHLALNDDPPLPSKVRPVPFNGDRLFEFKKCEEIKTENGCKYSQETGKECEYAHSDTELAAWEEKRKEVIAKKNRIRPIREGCRAELCQEVDCSGADCLEAHGEREKKAWSAVFGKLKCMYIYIYIYISSHAHAR